MYGINPPSIFFDEIKYYLSECENKNLSVRELHFKIKTKEYDRLPIEIRNELLNIGCLKKLV